VLGGHKYSNKKQILKNVLTIAYCLPLSDRAPHTARDDVIAGGIAAHDGLEATIADPDWKPLLDTPPFPDYLSGHSSFVGAWAGVPLSSMPMKTAVKTLNLPSKRSKVKR
jgi:hypothetical protein